ncbi:MAG TPA: MBL fold metallo-hydrolase [Chloroflexi bacterium]|nr:MBL fold metallo-hydrolase [Chloroflexota bacterium]
MLVKKTRIFPINTGWSKTDHGTYMFFKGQGGKKMEIPVICFYVDTGEHKIMVDTGLPDAERATKYHHDTEKRDCLDSPDALLKMGVDPEEIDICLFTHLHWDHTHNMKRFCNARYIAAAKEITWAYNPLPLYYRSYESPILGIEAPFIGCHFEVVEGKAEIVPGVSVFPTPGHTPGHQAVQVETSAGTIVLAGDAVFLYRNLEPQIDEHWRYWVPQRWVSMIDGWKSVEEIDRRADYVLPCHDASVLEHAIYPFEGMQLRKRREVIPGAPFYFSGI